MKRTIMFMILTGLYSSFIYGQSTSQEIVSSSGEHYTGTNVQLSWTIGEPMIDTYSTGPNQLTQGFHQTNLSAVGIEDLDESIIVNVYPNPTTQQLTIETNQLKGQYSINIYDVTGKLIYSKPIDSSANHIIDFSEHSNGSYHLHIINQDNNLIKTHQIIKSN